MASKRHRPDFDDLSFEWQPWTIGAVVVLVLGLVLYACVSVASAYPNNPLDALYRLLNPTPPITTPPVAPSPAPDPTPLIHEPAPAAIPRAPEPVTPIPWPSPPVILPPPVVILPPAEPPAIRQVKPQPGRSKLLDRKVAKEAARFPGKPKPTTEIATNEWLPPCWMVVEYAGSKSCAQLKAEGASRNPSARMRSHALSCLPRCKR